MEDFYSKRTGEQIEELLDIVSQGGGTITEAEIAAMGFTKNLGTITEVKMNGQSKGTEGVVDLGTVITAHQDISGKVDKVSGKQLSTEDFTTALKAKLEGLSNYDDTTISNAVSSLQTQINTLVSGNANDAINSFNEIIAFLDGVQDTQDLAGIIASIEQQIATKQDKITDLETIRSGAAKGATALQSVPSEYITESELNAKSYATTSQLSGKQDTITDLATIRSGAALGATALQSETYKGTVTGVKMNGTTKNPSSGVVDLGTIITAHQDISGKADKSSLATVATSGSYNDLSNKPTIPTAVTESTVSGWGFTKNTGTYSKPSSGIPASDLAPDVFLQGEKGDKGDKGDTGATGPQGVSVTSVAQTTTSSADGGSNVVTVTLSDGKTSTFTVKNGSKGSQGEKGDKGDTGSEGPQGVQGIQGIQGPKGDTGADGAQGPKGDQGEQGPKGDKGDKGDTGATGANGTNGKDGVSVSSVKQTTTSTADGGTNVVTVTLSNGTTSTFNVKNGSKGSNGTNGTNGTNGKDGTNGATFTPSVDSAGNLSWTNNGGLTNPPTVNIKGPKGDKGDAGSGGSGGGSGAYAEVNHGTSDTTFTLTPNTFHVWDEVTSLTLTLGSETSGVANEFVFQFTSGATATSLTLPDDIKWTNDSAPTIAENKIYQISVLKRLATALEFDNKPKVATISFKIRNLECIAEEGMTWEQWVSSEYNTINCSLMGNNVQRMGEIVGTSFTSFVTKTDVITSDFTYVLIPMT